MTDAGLNLCPQIRTERIRTVDFSHSASTMGRRRYTYEQRALTRQRRPLPEDKLLPCRSPVRPSECVVSPFCQPSEWRRKFWSDKYPPGVRQELKDDGSHAGGSAASAKNNEQIGSTHQQIAGPRGRPTLVAKHGSKSNHGYHFWMVVITQIVWTERIQIATLFLSQQGTPYWILLLSRIHTIAMTLQENSSSVEDHFF